MEREDWEKWIGSTLGKGTTPGSSREPTRRKKGKFFHHQEKRSPSIKSRRTEAVRSNRGGGVEKFDLTSGKGSQVMDNDSP